MNVQSDYWPSFLLISISNILYSAVFFLLEYQLKYLVRNFHLEKHFKYCVNYFVLNCIQNIDVSFAIAQHFSFPRRTCTDTRGKRAISTSTCRTSKKNIDILQKISIGSTKISYPCINSVNNLSNQGTPPKIALLHFSLEGHLH